ncbi:MAG: oxidoreductase [Bacteroidetes bacterium GWF2_42_66]|nr:MAG: oxidoreductase [Bacteroidetes bacterium GWA2_42_15]OFX98677.1 MAG: oxidoreductase [Bacteroidetes bacterium GWE2_42_39]OFY43125.1 MAG: oxidoreductase [Bacteroidetes bacterium GWF2_42_66]HBL77028.1 oxidoreductase [Prolixibacteraceae bacterium]HCR90119.1 oxidoreductase [Prolixibacteraceae bacterium]
MTKKIRFAVVGMGHIGKRHAEMIRRNPGAELVAVADVRSAEECGLQEITEPFYRSVDELLANEKNFDVLNICTPNGLHAPIAVKALEDNRHVVIEKPMALSKHDAEEIIHKSLEKEKHVFCVMQNRYSPPSVWLKSVIDQKLLGDIYQVQINCYWNRDARYYTGKNWHGDSQLDGGTLFTQFSHFIDIMYWLFGDINTISGRFNDFNHKNLTGFEDSGIVTFNFVKGGTGSLNYSTALFGENLESSMIIVAEKGTVKVAGQYMNEVAYCNIANYTMPELEPGAPPNDYGAYKGSAQNHHFVIRNVVEKLNNHSSISTNALEGMKVVDIIERIYAERDRQWKK